MFSIKTIIKSWIIAHNPNKEQTILAANRAEICKNCIHRGVHLTIPICEECGCPISKKIFTPEHNPCPKKKWESIDTKFFGPRKTNKTLL